MLAFLYQRIKNNFFLFLCLLCGAILASAIFSSIPMYSNAMFQRMLIKDLEQEQMNTNKYPGTCSVELIGEEAENYKSFEVGIETKYKSCFSLPLKEKTQIITTKPFYIEQNNRIGNWRSPITSAVGIENIEEHINIINGRLPDSGNKTRILEVILSQKAMQELELVLDNTYEIKRETGVSNNKSVTTIKVVGVFTYSDKYDYFWDNNNYKNLNDKIVINLSDLKRITKDNEQFEIYSVKWMFFYDYHKLQIEDVENVVNLVKAQSVNTKVIFNLFDVAKRYLSRQADLRMTLWILILPFIIVLCFFTLLVSGLIVKNDENEIAVLKSRGAGTIQIFALYTIQSFVMAVIATFVGPYIGLFICKFLGATNGFMEFVGRVSLPLRITSDVYLFSFVAAVIFMVFVLAPAYNSSRISIVKYKRKHTEHKKPLWETLFIDIIVLLIASYGLYKYNDRQSVLKITGLTSDELSIDPLLYFISTLFVIGIGLLFLRLYPYLLKVIYQLSKNRLSPVLFYSLINAGRAEKNARFIMLFIILSISFGLFNSNQARTINKNAEDKIRYRLGADIVLEPYRRTISAFEIENLPMPENEKKRIKKEEKERAGGKDLKDTVVFHNYQNIEGIKDITKVYKEDNALIQRRGVQIKNAKLMGIIPHEFSKVAWQREDLLPHHINEYMNMMTKAPLAVLISRDLEQKVKIGEEITIVIGEIYIRCKVYGFIDYFPTYNPYLKNDEKQRQPLVVANYLTLQSKLPSLQYEIWMKKELNVNDGEINDQLKEKELDIKKIEYTGQKLIQMKNDPMLKGTNGFLTLSFISTMLVTIAGYLIYWMLIIKRRSFNFGIFRAMGLSMKQITMIIISEQVLFTISAIIVGYLIGNASSNIFVPLLQTVYSAAQQVPPVVVVGLRSDYLKIAMIVATMIALGVTMLFIMIKSLNVNKIIKLGED